MTGVHSRLLQERKHLRGARKEESGEGKHKEVSKYAVHSQRKAEPRAGGVGVDEPRRVSRCQEAFPRAQEGLRTPSPPAVE